MNLQAASQAMGPVSVAHSLTGQPFAAYLLGLCIMLTDTWKRASEKRRVDHGTTGRWSTNDDYRRGIPHVGLLRMLGSHKQAHGNGHLERGAQNILQAK